MGHEVDEAGVLMGGSCDSLLAGILMGGSCDSLLVLSLHVLSEAVCSCIQSRVCSCMH